VDIIGVHVRILSICPRPIEELCAMRLLQLGQVAGMVWRLHEEEHILLVWESISWQFVPVHITIVEDDIAVMKGVRLSTTIF